MIRRAFQISYGLNTPHRDQKLEQDIVNLPTNLSKLSKEHKRFVINSLLTCAHIILSLKYMQFQISHIHLDNQKNLHKKHNIKTYLQLCLCQIIIIIIVCVTTFIIYFMHISLGL